MADIVSDPRYLAPIATSAGIAVTLVLWTMGLRNKEISYEIVSNTPLISLKEEVKDHIQIVFRNEPVHDVHLILVKVTNTGHIPIKASDFDEKLSINMDSEARILVAEIVETMPRNLEKRTKEDTETKSLISSISNNQVVLNPVLLNYKDYILVKLLASYGSKNPTVDGHIEGIQDIKKAKENNLVPILLANVGSFVMAVSLFFMEPSAIFSNAIGDYAPYLLLFLLGYVMLLSGVYYQRLSKTFVRPV